MTLDLSQLDKATQSLERAIIRAKKNEADEELRDAVIQRFEYTYELCWKMLKRQMEIDSTSPTTIDQLSFRDLFREATEKGFIDNPTSWFIYRDQRNITSHTYDEQKAEQVRTTAYEFLDAAKKLLIQLKQRQ